MGGTGTPMRYPKLIAATATSVPDLGGGSNVSDGWSDSVTISTNHTPEPATLALFGLGLGGAFLARRRLAGKKKGAAARRAPRS